MKEKFATIDHYIAASRPEVRPLLEQMRQTIRQAVPEAEETISYRIPAFQLNGQILVYFAAFKNHIGFYPTSSGIEAFKQELSSYKQGRGSVQFPLGKPLPLELVARIAAFRARAVRQAS